MESRTSGKQNGLANHHTKVSGRNAINYCFTLPQPDVMHSGYLICGFFIAPLIKHVCDWMLANSSGMNDINV